jgi:hypothetical protein
MKKYTLMMTESQFMALAQKHYAELRALKIRSISACLQ